MFNNIIHRTERVTRVEYLYYIIFKNDDEMSKSYLRIYNDVVYDKCVRRPSPQINKPQT